MDRRNFISKAATCLGLFTILPPATTYKRIWKAVFKQDSIGILKLPLNGCQFMAELIYMNPPRRFVLNQFGKWIELVGDKESEIDEQTLIDHVILNPDYKNPYA